MSQPSHFPYHHYDAPLKDAKASPHIWQMILICTIAAVLVRPLSSWILHQRRKNDRFQGQAQFPERAYAPSDDELCQLSDDASETGECSDPEPLLGFRQVRPPNQSSRRPSSHPYLPPQLYIVPYSTGNPPTFRRFSQAIRAAEQLETGEWTVTITIDTAMVAEQHSRNQHLRVLVEAVNWSVDQAQRTVQLRVQVAAERHWNPYLRRETLKFIEKLLELGVSRMQIRAVDIDVQALSEPHGPRCIQNGTTFSLPILESFKFSGNLYFDPSQHWRALWSLPFRSLRTLCLDNLGESGLHVHDCIAILVDFCDSSELETFSASPLVTGGARQPLLLAMNKKEMVSLTSLSIGSFADIRVFLEYILFPRLERVSLRLGNQDTMQAFVGLVRWRFIQSSELYGVPDQVASRDIISRLGSHNEGSHRHATSSGRVLYCS